MASTWRWYKRHFIGVDTSAAVIIATAIVATFWIPGIDISVYSGTQDERQVMYKTVATIAGTLTGFTITATALILNIWGHQQLSLITHNPARSKEMRTVLIQAMASMALTMLASLATMSVDVHASPNQTMNSIIVLAAVFATARLFETIWIVRCLATAITTSKHLPPR